MNVRMSQEAPSILIYSWAKFYILFLTTAVPLVYFVLVFKQSIGTLFKVNTFY